MSLWQDRHLEVLSSVLVVLIASGSRLEILAPLTPRDCALAFLTAVGAPMFISLGMMSLLLLCSRDVKLT